MRISEQVGILRELGPGDELLGDPTEDVRGREVQDSAGTRVGWVDALLIDDREHRVRLLRIGAGQPSESWLVPVDAVSRITDGLVTLNRPADHVAATPAFSDARTQRYLEGVYAHYGLYPYWAPGYVYPTYPVY